jgi:superfamily II DNA or RNA helicase
MDRPDVIISVGMISEGVDIPRLRVLVYLPNARTELAFRQAVGRVVRTTSPDDDTRAYVVIPTLEAFENYHIAPLDHTPNNTHI